MTGYMQKQKTWAPLNSHAVKKYTVSHLLTSFVVFRQCFIITFIHTYTIPHPGTINFWFSLKLTSSTTATAFHQARTELRQLKEEARNKHAVSVIWAGWQGTKVFGKPVDLTCRDLPPPSIPLLPIPSPHPLRKTYPSICTPHSKHYVYAARTLSHTDRWIESY